VPALEVRLIDIAVRRADRSSQETGLSLNIAPDLPALIPLGWEDVGARVWLPGWRKLATDCRKVLKGVTPAALPDLDWKSIGRKITAGSSDVDPLHVADDVIGAALAVVLFQAGFKVESHPARHPALVGPRGHIEPFGLREQPARAPAQPEAWRAFCAHIGIADVDLGSIG
jgi:hypothetical protein